jgi:hypothetical protein
VAGQALIDRLGLDHVVERATRDERVERMAGHQGEAGRSRLFDDARLAGVDHERARDRVHMNRAVPGLQPDLVAEREILEAGGAVISIELPSA